MQKHGPDPDEIYPMQGIDRLCFLKNIIRNPKIEVGDYTYYDDFDDVGNFERNVKYLFDFSEDKLIIGKFCMIASDVTFIMNGANHMVDSFSSYPFAAFGKGWEKAMDGLQYPFKGNTVIGNDVWIGYKATIMPGVTVGDGAIIGSQSVVVRDVPPYAVVGGNPAKVIRIRFDEEVIAHLLRIKLWNWEREKLTKYLPVLVSNNVERLKALR